MRRKCLVLLVAVTVVLPGGLPAFADVNTKRSVSFGDSITHNDLLFILFNTNPATYGADPFEAAFNKAAYEGDELLNFAFLGSTSADVLDQVEFYAAQREAGVLLPSTLVSIQAGGNDVLDNLAVLATAPPGTSREADRVTAEIMLNILDAVLVLQKVDRNVDTVIWTVPDVTVIPLVQGLGLPETALANVRRHIERINNFIRGYAGRNNVVLLDIYNILRQAAANPPTLLGMTLVGPPAYGDFDHIFADPIHPTAVANAIVANAMITQLNQKFDDDIALYNELELATLAFPVLAF